METVVEAARSAARTPPTRAKHGFVEQLPESVSEYVLLFFCVSFSIRFCCHVFES